MRNRSNWVSVGCLFDYSFANPEVCLFRLREWKDGRWATLVAIWHFKTFYLPYKSLQKVIFPYFQFKSTFLLILWQCVHKFVLGKSRRATNAGGDNIQQNRGRLCFLGHRWRILSHYPARWSMRSDLKFCLITKMWASHDHMGDESDLSWKRDSDGKKRKGGKGGDASYYKPPNHAKILACGRSKTQSIHPAISLPSKSVKTRATISCALVAFMLAASDHST